MSLTQTNNIMRKPTQEEFVAKALSRAKRPVDLSKFEYVGSAIKGIAVCPTHGQFMITPNALMNRIGCPTCALLERSDKRRMTTGGFIAKAQSVHQDKYDYSRVEYTSAHAKVYIVCPKHGEFQQGASSHLSGRGCPKCRNESVGDSCRIDQGEFLVRCVEKHGTKYDLSEVSYAGMTNKIKVICLTHGDFYPTAGNFVGAGSGCPACGRATVGMKSRKPLSYYVINGAKKHNGKFHYKGLIYKNSQAYLRLACPEHGEFVQLAHDHLKGIGCEKCARPVFDLESFIRTANRIHDNKYDYSKSLYTGALEKTTITCPTHGEFQQTPSSHTSGQGCPRCAGTGPSSGQLEIAEFLKQFTQVEVEAGVDDSRKRFDMFLPEHNLAVEYHGLIWHSTAFSADPLKDYKKHKIAEKAGVRVIHIYQDEWACRRPVVERTLMSAIGKLPKTYARQTTVEEIDRASALQFFKDNHLQGEPNSRLFLGLQFNEELVACMSFDMARSTRRNTDKRLWELQRYAATHTVVGGASKLLSAFLKKALCHTLISYSDNRAFTGRMYEKLGFTLEHETAPDYCYVSNNLRQGRVHKSKFQRKHLPSKLETFDVEKTEVENCRDNGWYQLFDCGKKKWSLKVE